MIFPGFSVVWRMVAIGVLAILAGSCTVVVEEGPGPRPVPPPGPQYCSREYAPVCAVRGPDRQTFANSCRARQAGYRIVRPGQCRLDPGPSRPMICTREYRPVCARRGHTVRTFGNACEARAADFRILGAGPC